MNCNQIAGTCAVIETSRNVDILWNKGCYTSAIYQCPCCTAMVYHVTLCALYCRLLAFQVMMYHKWPHGWSADTLLGTPEASRAIAANQSWLEALVMTSLKMREIPSAHIYNCTCVEHVNTNVCHSGISSCGFLNYRVVIMVQLTMGSWWSWEVNNTVRLSGFNWS